ncbi:MAG UNVERIFIED_CONTAM: four helix bundle protein [Microcystis novacekii LVE1205-3]|jgi:four helix bundle protein
MESKVYDKAYKFAIRIVKGYKYLCETKQEYILSKQLLRSGTSIGANIAEANGAISKADFRAKMSIAYKECLETKIGCPLKDTNYIEERAFQSINDDAWRKLGKMLWAILKTCQENTKTR